MHFERIEKKDLAFTNKSVVKVTTCGNVIETMQMEKVNRRGSSIVNLGDDAYCLASDFDADTGEIHGEIKYFERTENRGQNLSGIAQSMKAVRDLINCNVTDPKKCRWLTLTYAENMRDREKLYNDRKAFWLRVTRWHKKHGISVPEYITIVEPQGRGAWHLHELWLYDFNAPFLPNETVRNLWQNGFVTVKKLEDVDNVGAYITAYLCDVPLEEAEQNAVDLQGFEIKEAEVTTDDGSKITKKLVKGLRLHYYPSGMNFYRTSRNVKRPSVEWMKESEAKKKVKAATLTYSKSIRLSDDKYTNDIHYAYYNTIRRKSQEKPKATISDSGEHRR